MFYCYLTVNQSCS